MGFGRIIAVFLATTLLLVLGNQEARAQDTEACVAASGTGQKLRQQGKLIEARAQFELCATASCPSLVARNCTQWITEVSGMLPSVTLNAVDASNKDLIDVAVLLDGKPLISQLDGKAVAVNPGVHVFTFNHEGQAAVEERSIVSEGDRAKRIVGKFINLNVPAVATPIGPSGPGTSPPPPVQKQSRGLSAGPFIVGGLGLATLAVGSILFVSGISAFPSDKCDSLPVFSTAEGQCPRAKPEEKSDANSAAGSANAKRDVGAGVMIGGGALLIGGGVWLLIDVLSQKNEAQALHKKGQHRAWIHPVLGLDYAGLTGAF
jgi:hypothetical protein